MNGMKQLQRIIKTLGVSGNADANTYYCIEHQINCHARTDINRI